MNYSIKIIITTLCKAFDVHTKHIDIDCHVVRERLQANLFRIFPFRSNEQLVDIFTKSVHRLSFTNIISKLGIMSIHYPVRREDIVFSLFFLFIVTNFHQLKPI